MPEKGKYNGAGEKKIQWRGTRFVSNNERMAKIFMQFSVNIHRKSIDFYTKTDYTISNF